MNYSRVFNYGWFSAGCLGNPKAQRSIRCVHRIFTFIYFHGCDVDIYRESVSAENIQSHVLHSLVRAAIVAYAFGFPILLKSFAFRSS